MREAEPSPSACRPPVSTAVWSTSAAWTGPSPPSTWTSCRTGTCVSVGCPSDSPRPEKLGAVLSGAVSALAPALLDGRVQPLIDSRYDFRTAFEAVRRLASHQALGKIVLAVP
ncbi:zinc-binding dehydrogenase [Streptomyces sp. NPDC052494]|uniref:zinc-binding dehydrogenase n=1 Tax=Streptomyces sp. NPDC052494 TaxID=3365692 RepID=UPI0037D945F2